MASSSAGALEPPSIKELKTVMYARCSQAPPDKLFTQYDLLAMGFIPDNDINLLHQCVQVLVNERLFRVHQRPDGAVWKLVKKEDAER
jgi:DNA-directed RNA polymerase III subunit RPC6